jgi:hypothetical protein
MRIVRLASLVLACVAPLTAQRPVAAQVSSRTVTPPPTPASADVSSAARGVADRVAIALNDSSVNRRDRAISALRRASASLRSAAMTQLAAALTDSKADRRARALMALGQMVVETQGQIGMFDGGRDLAPALPAVIRIASDQTDALRSSALMLLAEAGRGSRARTAPVARLAITDADASIREAALTVLGAVGDSTDVTRVVAATSDRSIEVRIKALRALGMLGRREGVAPLTRALTDTSRLIRATALQALAHLGPTAASALPVVSDLVTDTTDWRGGGSYRETIGAEAAWAASRIIPRRGVGMTPARVDIDDRDGMLRSDGLGTYVAGADSVKAFVSAALNLDLSGARGDGRTTRLIAERALRRSLQFDLRKPARGSNAKVRAVARDREAIIHIFWKREPGKRMISVTNLDPMDAAVDVQRAEFEFRIDGEPHLLQMGEWTASEFDPKAPKVNGKGTSAPHLYHLNADEWTVVASPGSFARLWNVSDPSNPVDLGLYEFPFAITWAAILPR